MPEQQLSLFEKLKSLQIKSKSKPTEKTKKKSRGDAAEDLAYSFLLKQGLSLVEKNYNTRAGEVDLIMLDKKDLETLIFIEVRYRKNADFGGAAASVTPKKQQRIIKAALAYHQKYAPQSSMRFDVIAIEGDNIENHIEDNIENNTEKSVKNPIDIDWIKSAFTGF